MPISICYCLAYWEPVWCLWGHSTFLRPGKPLEECLARAIDKISHTCHMRTHSISIDDSGQHCPKNGFWCSEVCSMLYLYIVSNGIASNNMHGNCICITMVFLLCVYACQDKQRTLSTLISGCVHHLQQIWSTFIVKLPKHYHLKHLVYSYTTIAIYTMASASEISEGQVADIAQNYPKLLFGLDEIAEVTITSWLCRAKESIFARVEGSKATLSALIKAAKDAKIIILQTSWKKWHLIIVLILLCMFFSSLDRLVSL